MARSMKPMLDRVRNIVPEHDIYRHKGQAGRIGVVGGSKEYSGAPYFAAISALKVGADLVHVFCPKAVAPVIKSYSPELIVHPLLDERNAVQHIQPVMDRLHLMIIGPGLGNDTVAVRNAVELIILCRQTQKPLIIDADAISLVVRDPSLVRDYNGVILTPNAVEFSRLFGMDRDNIMEAMAKYGKGMTVLEKGPSDRIYDTYDIERFDCPLSGGSTRRCGGQGDLLAGALATFYYWARESKTEVSPNIVACFAASYLTRACNSYAYRLKGRSATCSDMIDQIHNVFEDMFEHKKE